MGKSMAAIILIFFLVTLAWVVLGTSVNLHTWNADHRLHDEVSGLWGSPQMQLSPELTFTWQETKTVEETLTDPDTLEKKIVTRKRQVWIEKPVILDSSEINVDLQLDHRKKGLLWYSTYAVDFGGNFSYIHDEEREGFLIITYRFPTTHVSYVDFYFDVDGKQDSKMVPIAEDGTNMVRERLEVQKGVVVPFKIGYRSRGLDRWRYSFGHNINSVKNFKLAMTTDFPDIDFSQGTVSPSSKEETAEGWRLEWAFTSLISGLQIGMEMPRKINPGPLAAKISYFAPVSLGFFFVWMFVITLLEKVRLHPMNYLFLGAAFFAFHLLFSYTVDHIDLIPAFLLASGVSVFLVVSYLRLVVGMRFAALEAGVSQLIYLVFFSYSHFLEGVTGLIITVGSIVTLFALMQLTGRFNWDERFQGMGRSSSAMTTAPDAR